MRAALYCRISKSDLESENESIQNQKALLTSFIKAQGWQCVKVYTDENYSGSDRSRPGFCRLLADAEQGRFDVVLCKTQSRFTRDMEIFEKYVHGCFPLWGVRFIAVVDHVDTSVPANKKARQISGLVNEWYLEDLSENIRAVLDHKRKNGEYIASFALYGYRKCKEDKHKLAVDEQAAPVVSLIFSLYAGGYGMEKIARLLNRAGVHNPTAYRQSGQLYGTPYEKQTGLWSRATIARILKNEMYIGTMVQKRRQKVSYKYQQSVALPESQWIKVAHTHAAIVDPALFQQVQQQLAEHPKSGGGGRMYPLSGKVRCAECGAAMEKYAYEKNGVRYTYLRCPKGSIRHNSLCCNQRSIRADRVEQEVLKKVRQHLIVMLEEPCLSLLTRALSPKLEEKEVKKQLSHYRRLGEKFALAGENLYMDKAAGLIDENQFPALAARLRAEREHAQAEVQRLEAQLLRLKQEDVKRYVHRQLEQLLKSRTLSRELVLALIDHVEITRIHEEVWEREIHVYWRF